MIAPVNPLRMPDLDYNAINRSIARGIHEAVLNRARLGLPVSVWRNGKVVILSPEEVMAEEAAENGNQVADSVRSE